MPLKSSLIAVLLALCVAALAQQPTATPRPSTTAQTPTLQPADDAKTEAEAIKTGRATIQWDKSSTPGTKARLELIKTGTIQGKPVVDYRLKVDGAPHDKRYKLFVWPVTVLSPIQMMDGLAVGNDGTVMCPADSTRSCAQRFKGTEVHLTYRPEIGEIYRQALISEDDQSRIFFSIVPAPITHSDKACTLEAVRLSPSFELALIRGKGFKPGEDISVHTQSYQDAHNVPAKADDQGEFFLSITPAVKGRTTGVIEVSAKSASCSPLISFNWGL
ncbi:MAG: hypothetical protein LAO20_13400 [Acidobacteriia bacterium]|nr:hypothetical protein [Terriglobia bacterium]